MESLVSDFSSLTLSESVTHFKVTEQSLDLMSTYRVFNLPKLSYCTFTVSKFNQTHLILQYFMRLKPMTVKEEQ